MRCVVLAEEARRTVSVVLSVRTASLLAGTEPAGPTSAALVPSITLNSPELEAEGVPGRLDAAFRPVSRSVRSRPLRSLRVGVPRLFGVPGVPGVPSSVSGAPGVVGVVGLLKFPSLVNMLNPLRDFRLVSGFDGGIMSL